MVRQSAGAYLALVENGASASGLLYPYRRHHPTLGPVVGVVQQRRRGVDRCCIELPSCNDAVAYFGQEELKIERPTISATDVLDVGVSLRMPETQSGTMLGSLRPIIQSTPLACPHSMTLHTEPHRPRDPQEASKDRLIAAARSRSIP